jgi:hypothetical protein
MAGRVALLLLATACEYDARISVNPPDWAEARVIGVEPVDCVPGGAWRIGFVLVDDRDDPIVDGSSVELASGEQVVAGAATLSARISGVELTPVAGGDPAQVPEAALGSIAWRASDDAALVVVVEASSQAAAADPGDERFRAADGAARRFLAEPSRRLAVYSLAGGGVDERLPATTDVALAADAIGAIALVQGGDAPLWDGAIAAGETARAASPGGGAVLLVGAALVDRGSIADADDAIAALAGTPVRAVALVDDPAWRGLACASGGWFLAVPAPEHLPGAAAAMVHASAGSWTGTAAIPVDESLPAGAHRLTGTLHVTLGSDERAVPLDVTIDVPGE